MKFLWDHKIKLLITTFILFIASIFQLLNAKIFFDTERIIDDISKESQISKIADDENLIFFGLSFKNTLNFDDLIYKQSLIPLTPLGSTVIFKNRFYGESTNFTIDKNELDKKELKYGQNKRSSEHLNMFKNKPFDEKLHKKFLNHEDINNLNGLEVELVYEWELGSMLIFDRTNLHCSSSVINGKKLGLTTFTKK